MWKKNEQDAQHPETSTSPASPAAGPAAGGRAERRTEGGGPPAVIGTSITVQGTISGEEDLVIQGSVNGEVRLRSYRVTVGRDGRVEADVHGRILHVEGKAIGNLFGDEEVVIRTSGQVEGNITAPRVTLEDGCTFRGSIDMTSPKKSSEQSSEAAARPKKTDSAATGPERKAGDGTADTKKAPPESPAPSRATNPRPAESPA